MKIFKMKSNSMLSRAILFSGVSAFIYLTALPNSIHAQEKNCTNACSLYYDCVIMASKYNDDMKSPQKQAELKREKTNIINKCTKECNAKQNTGNILQCYKTRTPTQQVCTAFYECSLKFYKSEEEDMKKKYKQQQGK